MTRQPVRRLRLRNLRTAFVARASETGAVRAAASFSACCVLAISTLRCGSESVVTALNSTRVVVAAVAAAIRRAVRERVCMVGSFGVAGIVSSTDELSPRSPFEVLCAA